jgi:5-methylthioadenosine/S-adenosylhomocysteine deaminase
MATIEGAKVLGLEDEIGTIEVGKKADIILINTDKLHLCPENDICTNLVYSANGADVDTVIIDGKIIMKNREMLNVNENEIMNKVRNIAERLCN